MRAVYLDTGGTPPLEATSILEDAGFDVSSVIVGQPAADEAIAGASALLVGDAVVDDALLAAAPFLRIVATITAGTNQIDLDAAQLRGVWVANAPGATSEEVAVHAVAMILSLVRGLPRWHADVAGGGWDWTAVPKPRRLSRLRLGIVGVGRIGRRVAALASPFVASVDGFDPLLPAADWPEGVGRVDDLGSLLRRSDVLTLHAPLESGGGPLLDAPAIALLPAGAIVVNVARGGLIDQRALLDAIDAGRLAGAGLDVLQREPPAGADPVRRNPRVLLSPHVAFLSEEGEHDTYMLQARNVVAWRAHGRPLTPVVEGRS